MLLGLDISTSIVGATVLNDEGEVVYCDFWDLRNKNQFLTLYSLNSRCCLSDPASPQHEL